jgi:hypothetical protein
VNHLGELVTAADIGRMTRRSVLVARRTFLLHRQQLEDLHRALPVAAGQEREAVGERLRRSEIVGLDDRVADEIASWSFSAVVANGALEPNGLPPSTRAAPTFAIQAPNAAIRSAPCSGVRSDIGVAGPR